MKMSVQRKGRQDGQDRVSIRVIEKIMPINESLSARVTVRGNFASSKTTKGPEFISYGEISRNIMNRRMRRELRYTRCLITFFR